MYPETETRGTIVGCEATRVISVLGQIELRDTRQKETELLARLNEVVICWSRPKKKKSRASMLTIAYNLDLD